MEVLKKVNKNLIVVHYDRNNFGELSDVVLALYLYNYLTDEYLSFEFDNSRYTESKAIKACTNEIQRLQSQGFIIVHWNQNRPEYGPQHINKRYKHLTGNDLGLDYGETQINLAGLLFDVYGDDYISHPRLDNLISLNNFKIEREGPLKNFERLNHIVKIFYAAQNETLKTKSNLALELEKKQEMIDRLKVELKLAQSDEKVLDRSEVIELLGVSEGTLSNWVRNNEIPYTRIGRRLFFLKSRILTKMAE
ncbi:excisionase family DNA binding protein [Flavobacteriaceae bacterium MAR_2009_75]|nr:excisionase family DNA binding protein [Flavobacteriaceae bacterium MAR_2009_75]